MGLSAYGHPRTPRADFFEIRDNGFVFRDVVPAQFPDDVRWPDRQEAYQDLAASVQQALEEASRCSLILPATGWLPEGMLSLAEGAAYVVTTLWGETSQWVPREYLPLLASLDGVATGWDLLSRSGPGPLSAEGRLVDALAFLRRLRVIALTMPPGHGRLRQPT